MDPVLLERNAGVATLRIDDGEGNRFGRSVAEALRKAALSLQDDPPNAVVVEGSATHFSTGLATSSDPLFQPFGLLIQSRDAFRAQEIVQRYRNALAGIGRLPCPVIAAIEGTCAGPLIALALSADIRVASIESRFEPTPLARGVLPGMGELSQLANRAGVDRIAETVLTGGSWDATEALALGLVSRLVAAGTASEQAHLVAKEILEQPDTSRLQALVTLRAIANDPASAEDAEAQGGARTWIRGEWRR